MNRTDVAVTGLPKAQPNHAVLLVQFAALAMEKMNEKIRDLAGELGDDTLELAMRVGIHSGPVTAGVLRGDKARFQLFGDTVNTAARMESTGKPGRIQVSEATAQCLRDAGKHSWLTRRSDSVIAKGKGTLNTWFVNPSVQTQTASITDTSSQREDGDDYDVDMPTSQRVWPKPPSLGASSNMSP